MLLRLLPLRACRAPLTHARAQPLIIVRPGARRAPQSRAMKVTAQVVGLETGDSAPSVLVSTDAGRYLFDVGEGLQRFCSEHRARLVKLDAVFVSQVCAARAGGLPGLLLTLADMGRSGVAVFGAPGLHDFAFALRHFLRRDDFALHAVELHPPAASAGAGAGASSSAHARSDAGAGARVGASSGALSRRCARAVRLPTITRPDLVVTPIMLIAPRGMDNDSAASAASVGAVAGGGVESGGGAITHAAGPVATVGGFREAVDAHVLRIPHALGRRPFENWLSDAKITAPPTFAADSGSALSDASRRPTEAVASWAPGASCSVQLPGPFSPLTLESRGSGGAVAAPAPLQHLALAESSRELSSFAYAASSPSLSSLAAAEQQLFARAHSDVSASPQPNTAAAAMKPDVGVGEGALCYVCSTLPVAGRFHPERAKALGVPVGPLFGTLMRGEAVTLDAAAGGRVVNPLDVKDPDSPGQVIAIIACPSEAFLSALLSSDEAFAPFLAASGDDSGPVSGPVRCMFHMTPTAVASTEAYAGWMRRFGPGTQHVMLDHVSPRERPMSPSNAAEVLPALEVPTMFFDQAVLQCKLNVLRPGTFALPQPLPAVAARRFADARGHVDDPRPLSPLQLLAQIKRAEMCAAVSGGAAAPTIASKSPGEVLSLSPFETDVLGVPALNAPPLLSFTLVPISQQGFVRTVPALPLGSAPAAAVKPPLPWLGSVCPELAIQPMLEDAAMAEHLDRALTPLLAQAPVSAAGHAAASSAASPAVSVPEDAEVIFTGTSSAVPNKYRNVSGIFVRMPPPPFFAAAEAGDAREAPRERHAIFLDCGEGSYGSLVRRLGRSRSAETAADNGGLASVDEAVACISCIWISHMHADHHLGALRLAVERARARRRLGFPHKPVLVVGPTRMFYWLLEMSRVDAGLAGEWRFVDAEHFVCVPSTSSTHATVSATSAPSELRCWAASGSDDETLAPPAGLRGPTSESGQKRPRPPSPPSTAQAQSPLALQSWAAPDDVADDNASLREAAAGPQHVFAPETLREAPRSSRRPASYIVPTPHAHSKDCDASGTESGTSLAEHLADQAFCDSVAAGLGLSALRAVRVRHCNKAYGLRLEILSRAASASPAATSSARGGNFSGVHPWSLLYSGDTRPCSEMVALGRGGASIVELQQFASAGGAPRFSWWRPDVIERTCGHEGGIDAAAEAAAAGCSLLIHEATFEDDDDGRANALAKRHSTAAQACEVAADMGARHTLLTHFSARYPKLPVLKVGGGGGGGGSAAGAQDASSAAAAADAAADAAAAGRSLFVAYDLMRVTGRDLAQLPALLPALHALFAEDAAEVDDAIEALR